MSSNQYVLRGTFKDSWKKGDAIFSDNENKLFILGHPVMESWEAPFMEKLANIATSKGGAILEVGFGLGIASSFI